MFVCMNASIYSLCCNDFAEIVSKRKQHKGIGVLSLITVLCRSVQYLHGVSPDVPLRMELRVLLYAYERLYLREPDVKTASTAKNLEKCRRLLALEQGFFQFYLHPFSGKLRQLHAPAKSDGLLRHAEAETRRKLRSPENSQRIISKGAAVYMANNSFF